jgi:hypothetical protein
MSAILKLFILVSYTQKFAIIYLLLEFGFNPREAIFWARQATTPHPSLNLAVLEYGATPIYKMEF